MAVLTVHSNCPYVTCECYNCGFIHFGSVVSKLTYFFKNNCCTYQCSRYWFWL